MMLNVGGAFVKIDEIEVIAPPESAPLKRLVSDSKDNNTCLDLTYGKRTKAVIVLKSGKIVLSPITAGTLANKMEKCLFKQNNENS